MLIAAAFAAALAAAPVPMPPMTVRVEVAHNIPPTLVAALLDEANAIWRRTGITFIWARDDRDRFRTALRTDTPNPPGMLRILIGHTAKRNVDGKMPLGWIVFDDATTPEQEIEISYANAVTLLESSRGVVGKTETMPRLERETLLARAMGRALAHELGHYLSASKVHSEHGLMKAVLSAFELFVAERSHFSLGAAEQRRVVARFTSIYMASRG
jgi:hypothetical protein